VSLVKVLSVVVVIVLLFAGWAWWSGDAQRINRRLGALTDEVEKTPGEGQLTTAFKAEAVAAFFAEPFRFRARQFDFETTDRSTLVRSVAAYRLRSEHIATDILHRHLEIDPVARTARMEILVRFAGGWGGRAAEAYRFQLDWIEQEGRWQIGYVDLIEIVRPLAP
jgi:hypothetical protein